MTAKMTVVTAGELFMIMGASGNAVVMRADPDGQCTDVTTEYLRGKLKGSNSNVEAALAQRRLDKGE